VCDTVFTGMITYYFFPQNPCPRQGLDSIQKMRQLLGIFILFLQAVKPVLFTLHGWKAE